jgi:MscS family membrane protein
MLQAHPEVHPEIIVVNFDEFEASALSILLNFFTNTIVTDKYLHVREDINFKIMEIVARNGAQFAFPSQSLYVESLPK